MKKQKLVIRKFCFVDSNGKKCSRPMPLQEMIMESDFTNQDVENICILPVGEMVFLTSACYHENGIRRVK